MWAWIRELSAYGLFLIVSSVICSEAIMLARAEIAIQIPSFEAGVCGNQSDQKATDSRTLAPDQLIERELSSGSVHSYQISLDSGQYLRLLLDPWGIDVGIALYRPGGKVLTEFGCRQDRPTPVLLVAESAGTYRLEFRALERDPVRGRYKLQVEQIRKATGRDKTRLAGERAFSEGEKLRAEWSAESDRKAIKKYEEAVVRWKAAGERLEISNGFRAIGEIYHLLGNSQKALEYLKRALQLSKEAGDQVGECAALNAIATVDLQLGDNEKALDDSTKALNLSRATRNRRGEALALNGIGDIHAFYGDMRKSLDSYNQALPLWQDLNDRRGLAQTLMNIGYDYSDLSDEDQALKYLDKALVLWRAVNHRRGEGTTIRALAHVQSKLGEKEKALNLFDQARLLLQPMGDKAAEAALLGGMGQVYLHLGENQKALDYSNQALQIYQRLAFQSGEGATLSLIGRCYFSMGDSQKALVSFQRALSVFRSLSDQKYEAIVVGEIGKIFESLGDKEKALEYYNQALSLKQITGERRTEAWTLNNVGHIYHESREYEKAWDYYVKALPLNRSVGDRYGECSTLYNMGRLERDRGNLVEACSLLETSLGVVESLRSQVSSQELRASYFASVRRHYDLYVDLLMQMHKQQPAEGFDAASLQASERARARSLLESLAEARTDIRQGVDPNLLERERALQKLLTAKTDRQMRLLSGKPNEAEAAAVSKEINDLTTRFDEVQALIRSKSPRYAALTQPQPLSLSEIQQVLDENTLLLEYALGDERSYLWAVTKTEITSYELPKRAEIEKTARHIYELLIAGQPKPGETPKQHQTRVKEADAQYAQHSAALSQMLLGPAAARLASKRLLIVTEGALQYLPFGALPIPQVNPTERVDALTPLVVEHEIVSLPSASAMAALRRETLQRKVPPRMAAVLADPVFETDDPRLLRAQATGKRPNPVNRSRSARRSKSPPSDLHRALRDVGVLRDGLAIPRLLFTSREADAIMEVIPKGEGLKAIGFKASRETATSPDLGQYRVVHFATHGLLNSEHPELSGIVLSMLDEQGRPQNGFLGLRDVYNLNLPVDLVVLSACSTGLGKDIKGEGLVGIVRGFMYAGAARVVASLWKVDDEATAALMKLFYKQMFQGGMAPAAALRAAQIEMWKQKNWRSPYYWAAFVLQGEWK